MLFFQHVRQLKFEEKPNYQYLKRILKDLFIRKEGDNEPIFDWTLKYIKKIREANFGLTNTEEIDVIDARIK